MCSLYRKICSLYAPMTVFQTVYNYLWAKSAICESELWPRPWWWWLGQSSRSARPHLRLCNGCFVLYGPGSQWVHIPTVIAQYVTVLWAQRNNGLTILWYELNSHYIPFAVGPSWHLSFEYIIYVDKGCCISSDYRAQKTIAKEGEC